MLQFRRWFYRALQRTGLLTGHEDHPLVVELLDSTEPETPEVPDREILPWAVDADA